MSVSPVAAWVHETSVVEPDVQLGAGTKVWLFCHLLSGTRIGQNCSLGQNCVIGPNVRVGNGVRVQNNVSIFEGVEVEDDVFLGPSVVFTNVRIPRAFLRGRTPFTKTLVKRGSSLGANATVLAGVTIGDYALVGAGSVVTHDVPAFGLVTGNPATLRGFVGTSGERLVFDEHGMATDPFTQERFRLVNSQTVVRLP